VKDGTDAAENPAVESSVIEACPVCDTLWRLYARAIENLKELVGKHADARGRGDQNTVEILAHEIPISESALRAVSLQLRRHKDARHKDGPKQQPPPNQK
jgi:hypothetical protein